MVTTILIALTTGVIAGVLSGMLGVGGGIILVPIMVFALGLSQHIAQGISLVVIIPTAAAGIWHLHKEKLVDYHTAGLLSCGAVIGALISASIVQDIPAVALKKIFGTFIIIMGARMTFAKKNIKTVGK